MAGPCEAALPCHICPLALQSGSMLGLDSLGSGQSIQQQTSMAEKMVVTRHDVQGTALSVLR